MTRYVILEHDHPAKHWDLMLEAGDVLRTWRLAMCPLAGAPISAEATFDHRPFYLDYEGPISGGRGNVLRWDSGEFAWLADEPDRVTVRLEGRRCRGTGLLMRQPDGTWSFQLNEPQLEPGL
jgi:hypothetical protein